MRLCVRDTSWCLLPSVPMAKYHGKDYGVCRPSTLCIDPDARVAHVNRGL